MLSYFFIYYQEKILKKKSKKWFCNENPFKRPFVCVVASAFEATTANTMFSNIKNTI